METDAQFMRRMSATRVRSFRDFPTQAEIKRVNQIESERMWSRILRTAQSEKRA